MNKNFYFLREAILLLSMCLLLPAAQGQTLKAYEKAADEAFLKKDYYNAVHYYEIVLESKKNAGIYFKYAESCRLTYAYKKAEEAYLKVIRDTEARNFPKADFYYALVLKHNGQYSKASTEFNQYVRRHPQDNYFKKKALQEIEACRWAEEATKRPVDTIDIEP